MGHAVIFRLCVFCYAVQTILSGLLIVEYRPHVHEDMQQKWYRTVQSIPAVTWTSRANKNDKDTEVQVAQSCQKHGKGMYNDGLRIRVS